MRCVRGVPGSENVQVLYLNDAAKDFMPSHIASKSARAEAATSLSPELSLMYSQASTSYTDAQGS